jgi:hypothetical protein
MQHKVKGKLRELTNVEKQTNGDDSNNNYKENIRIAKQKYNYSINNSIKLIII